MDSNFIFTLVVTYLAPIYSLAEEFTASNETFARPMPIWAHLDWILKVSGVVLFFAIGGLSLLVYLVCCRKDGLCYNNAQGPAANRVAETQTVTLWSQPPVNQPIQPPPYHFATNDQPPAYTFSNPVMTETSETAGAQEHVPAYPRQPMSVFTTEQPSVYTSSMGFNSVHKNVN